MRIFLAGATGAIGKRLVPLLLEAGYQVIGTTRSPSRAEALRAAGVEPAQVDVFPNSYMSTDKARRELGFDATFRLRVVA